MSVERMWNMASTISAIAGLFASAILVARFYIPYVIKKKAASLTNVIKLVLYPEAETLKRVLKLFRHPLFPCLFPRQIDGCKSVLT